MNLEIGEVCNDIVKEMSQNSIEDAKSYCRKKMDTEIKPESQKYSEVKSDAISETEVWGDEAEKWVKILPAAASEQETDSEWKFVLGNFLLSSVIQCETTGDLRDDALIAKAAHECFKDLHKSDRHEKLSLAIYYHKRGHIAKNYNDDYEGAVEYIEDSIEIIYSHDCLGGWHHHALIARDLARVKVKYYEENEEYIKCTDVIDEFKSEIEETNAPTSDKFANQLKAEEHRIRAKIADKLEKDSRKRKHLRKCANLYEENGKENLAQKFRDKELKVGSDKL